MLLLLLLLAVRSPVRATTRLGGIQRPLCEIQMHGRGLEQVAADLVVIRDGPYDLRADMLLIVERLELAPHPCVAILDQPGFLPARRLPVLLALRVVRVDPLLDLDGAGAVVELVGDVRGLRGDVADLRYESDGGDFGAVDAELALLVLGFGRVDLLDGYRAERVFAVALVDGCNRTVSSSVACFLTLPFFVWGDVRDAHLVSAGTVLAASFSRYEASSTCSSLCAVRCSRVSATIATAVIYMESQ